MKWVSTLFFFDSSIVVRCVWGCAIKYSFLYCIVCASGNDKSYRNCHNVFVGRNMQREAEREREGKRECHQRKGSFNLMVRIIQNVHKKREMGIVTGSSMNQ